MDKPVVSVVIPAYNEEKYLPKVLESLRPINSKIPAEIVVVDVGSTDGTARIADEWGAKVLSTHRMSPGAARNLGVCASAGEILVFLDADVEVTSTWLSRVVGIVKERGGVTDEVLGFPYGTKHDGGWIEKTWFSPSLLSRPSYINGGNMIIRRNVFFRLGCFDEFLPTGEDVDLCAKARKSGIRVVFDPALKTVHHGYPATAWDFMLREAWHGAGDKSSLSSAIKSRIFISSLLFALAIFMFFLGFFLSIRIIYLPSGLLVAIMPTLLAVRRFGGARTGRPKAIFLGWPVAVLYLFGRAIGFFLPVSVVLALRSRSKRKD